MATAVFLEHLNHQTFVVGNGELVESKHGHLFLATTNDCDVVERPDRCNDCFLNCRAFGNLFVNNNKIIFFRFAV